jgi:L-ribulose-5-phosphate 3-epimerase
MPWPGPMAEPAPGLLTRPLPTRPLLTRAQLAGIGDEAGRSLAEQLAVHRELGFPGIELRTVQDRPLATLDPAERRRVATEVADSGLRVVALDSKIGDWSSTVDTPVAADLAELDVLAELAGAVGSRYVRIMSYPNDGRSEADWRDRVLDRIAVLAERAAGRGVVLVHENCAGWAARDPVRARALIEHAGSPALRLVFDIGNPLTHGDDPLAYLRPVLDSVVHVHVKDAVHDPHAGTVEFTLPGAGTAPLREALGLLAGAGYAGAVSLEPHVARVHHLGRTVSAERLRASYVEYARRFVELVGCTG